MFMHGDSIMNSTMLTSLLVSSILLCGAAQAGNNPNTTKTLTNGIGSGTSTAGVRSSLPYNAHASKRNSKADVSLSNYRGGYSHRPEPSGRSTTSTVSSSRPSLPAQASGHTPETIGGKPSGVGGTAPGSIPASIPSQAADRVPATIGGPVGSSSSIVTTTPPSSIPATIPGQAADRVPTTIGRAADRGVDFAPPPSIIPATIPGQAADRVPASIGGRP
jgi:hypothetical protein